MQEAQQTIELLLDAFLFVSRARDMLADTKALLLHAAPQAASRLQVALQREQDVLGAGVPYRLPLTCCVDLYRLRTFEAKRATVCVHFNRCLLLQASPETRSPSVLTQCR